MNIVRVIPLDLHLDARGWVMAADKEWGHIAYTYATMCNPGVIKGWHRHEQHTDRLMCVQGTARIVVAKIVSGDEDMGPGSLVTSCWDIKEIVIGPLDPAVVVIQPGWWHAFTPAGNEPCVIVNFPDMPYDPVDEERAGLGSIPWEWEDISR